MVLCDRDAIDRQLILKPSNAAKSMGGKLLEAILWPAQFLFSFNAVVVDFLQRSNLLSSKKYL